ncbi:MurR/RpiR family transcriptional regulator [Clostridium sp. AM58-1XD]|uniref:MurR/RpiR family transcriptional regulator n=1 Tax=Clostridium sp. AM58-1XD TaxID=2292307 RepID=UPI000E469A11|nr:MurR/RpiR family transcriptional regulator [Clostridium sp. AM58-1XD]RGZ00874.1 MurR/RpiR family transcriptional regulator [Clostridium sp. AM58-1XD]
MRLENLINENFDELNENDMMIWRYIQSHKKECCSISIVELAQKCCISRTTISRFTQKLSFEGFREFKIRLKLEFEQEQIQNALLLDDVCMNYAKCIQTVKETDMNEICEYISKADRLFVFGTGEVQNAAAQMIKRMFLNAKRFFVTLYGKSEVTMAMEDLGPRDFVIIISLSGENHLAVETAKKLRGKGVYILSITGLSNNTVAKMSNKNLFITTTKLMNTGGVSLETCSSYFNIAELLCVKYLMYLEKTKSECES